MKLNNEKTNENGEEKETYANGTLTKEELIMLDSLLYYEEFAHNENSHNSVGDFVKNIEEIGLTTVMDDLVSDDKNGMNEIVQRVSNHDSLPELEIVSCSSSANMPHINAVCLMDKEKNVYFLYGGNYGIGDYDFDENEYTSETTWQSNFIGAIEATTDEYKYANEFFNQTIKKLDEEYGVGNYNGDYMTVMDDMEGTLIGERGNDILNGKNGADKLYGGIGRDQLYGNGGNDLLEGGEGNDYLNAGEGNDILDGGKGNDTLNGGDGDDTYRFSKEIGWDVIEDNLGTNKVVFLDVTMDDVTISKDRDDNLLIAKKDTKDILVVKAFEMDKFTFEFADSTKGTIDDKTAEWILTQPEETDPVQTGLTEEELIQANADLLSDLYTEDTLSEELFAQNDTSILADTPDTVSLSEENKEVADQTDIQAMILTENMSAFGEEENVSAGIYISDISQETSNTNQLYVDSLAS